MKCLKHCGHLYVCVCVSGARLDLHFEKIDLCVVCCTLKRSVLWKAYSAKYLEICILEGCPLELPREAGEYGGSSAWFLPSCGDDTGFTGLSGDHTSNLFKPY